MRKVCMIMGGVMPVPAVCGGASNWTKKKQES